MNISPMMNLPLTASALPGVLARTPSPVSEAFGKVTGSAAQDKRRRDAEDGAAGLVSQALIMPILKQLRRSTFNTQGPFSPGTGEKAFGPEFDMEIADRIAHSPRLGIKEALTKRLMKSHEQPDVGIRKLDVHG